MHRISYNQPIFLTHKELGEGLLTSVQGRKAIIKFPDNETNTHYDFASLNVNEEGSVWTCSDETYQDYQRIEERFYACEMRGHKSDVSYKSEFNYCHYLSELRGPIVRALNIDFTSDEAKMKAIAFLAAYQPHIYATVYEGKSLDSFIQDYPDQPYTIDTCETGLIHATHFTLGLSTQELFVDIMPEELKNNRNSAGNVIARTAFIRELVDNYGFVFGNAQDINQIKHKIEELPFYDVFCQYYEDYKQQIDHLYEIGILRKYNQIEEIENDYELD